MRTKQLVILAVLLAVSAGFAERIKDITTIDGAQSNELNGVGLVIGLDGSGDNSNVAKRMLSNYYRRHNMAFDPNNVDAANAAVVAVTAILGPSDRVGAKIDVSVSATGSATSLQGGKLLLTYLKGADGRVYATSQGSVLLGGFGAAGNNATVTQGHLTSGEIPDGGTVVREELAHIVRSGEVTLLLKNRDHSTAQYIAAAINSKWQGIAHAAADGGAVRVKVPETVKRTDVNQFVHTLGLLEAQVDQPARVVVNEKTGTIIVGQNVTISTVAIAHGNLTITVEEKDYVSQPTGNFGDGGTTAKMDRTSIRATQKEGILRVVPQTLTVTQLAQALNAMGLTPRDLISIFQAIKAAGALQADLKTM
ncbi:MAG: flagellar basal body P-ring protein FlgI [Phycisphaerae bacterium]|nr:flagellar basal body P-ring protein FlgI [Phycisphaerae bacterium]